MILNDLTIQSLSNFRPHDGKKPLIYPFTKEQLNPASYDVVLGNSIQVQVEPNPEDYQFHKPIWSEVSIAGRTAENPWLISPGEAILANTLERFNLPDNLSCMFKLKSSRARELYDHMFAGFGDPGWYGSTYTLELVNHGRWNQLPIYPGLKIGQIVFWETMEVGTSYAVTGHYNSQSKSQPSIT